MRTRHESIGTAHSEEGTTKEASSERLHKAGSLISMTSQVINIYSTYIADILFFSWKSEDSFYHMVHCGDFGHRETLE